MKIQVAERMNHIEGSVIRQFAEAALKPGLITFANGNPAPATYPIEEMKNFLLRPSKAMRLRTCLCMAMFRAIRLLLSALKSVLPKNMVLILK